MAKTVMGIDFLGLEDGSAPTTSRPGMSSTMTGVHTASMTNFNTLQQESVGVKGPAAPPAASSAATDGFTARRRGNDFRFLSPLPLPQQPRPRFLAQTPVRSPASGSSSAETSPAASAAAPLTIFYNGSVSTFHLPPDKAEAIINWADRTTPPGTRRMERPVVAFVDGSHRQPPAPQPPQPPAPQPFSSDKLGRDLPLARKRSLQRFLEKRKER